MNIRFIYKTLLICIVVFFANCQDNDNWIIVEEVPNGVFYMSGSATVYSALGPAAGFKTAVLDGSDATPDMQSAYTWLQAGKELYLSAKDEEGNIVNYGKGELAAGETYNLTADATGFTVAKDGLYMIILNKKELQATILSADYGVIGDATPGGWDHETLLTDISFNESEYTVTFKGIASLTKASMKMRFHDSWGVDIPYNGGMVKVKTDEGSQMDNDNDVSLSSSSINLKAGGKNIAVGEGATYDITFVYNLRTTTFSISVIQGEIIEPEYPDNIYMIGADFGDWSWDSPDIVELIPVHGKEVYSFWTIKYLTAGNGFKFASAKGWDGSFGVLGEVEGVTTDNDGNARVAESGLYMIYIDMVNEKMVIEKPQVSGMGDAFGGWTMGQYPFTIDAGGKLMSITTLNAGDLRICTTSSLAQEANIDWWKMEFIILNGKIEYRGQGNDQTRVPVTAGKVVTLNFQNNTGTIQ